MSEPATKSDLSRMALLIMGGVSLVGAIVLLAQTSGETTQLGYSIALFAVGVICGILENRK